MNKKVISVTINYDKFSFYVNVNSVVIRIT